MIDDFKNTFENLMGNVKKKRLEIFHEWLIEKTGLPMENIEKMIHHGEICIIPHPKKEIGKEGYILLTKASELSIDIDIGGEEEMYPEEFKTKNK